MMRAAILRGRQRNGAFRSTSAWTTSCHIPWYQREQQTPDDKNDVAASFAYNRRALSTHRGSVLPPLPKTTTTTTTTTRRDYHATPQQPLVLYGTIIIVSATAYVIYRKAQGKPISPDSLIDAKREFEQTKGKFSRAAFERRQREKMNSSDSSSRPKEQQQQSSKEPTQRRNYHTLSGTTTTSTTARCSAKSSLYNSNSTGTALMRRSRTLFPYVHSRGLAWQAKWKQKAPRKKPNKRKSSDQLLAEKLRLQAQRRQKKLSKNMKDIDDWRPAGDLIDEGNTPDKSYIPPALLLPTGSPYAYVAKSTAEASGMDPRDLFPWDEMQQEPPLFRGKNFVYDGVETLDSSGGKSATSNKGTTTHNKISSSRHVPQVAFLGRSNVGKSSLVNALMNRELARCSKQPGRTQQVHRFALVHGKDGPAESPSGVFLDLPGYGFAVAPDDVLEDWQRKTQKVLRREYREGNLKRIFVLIDARQGVTSVDQTVLEWLQGTGQMPYTLVWTKTDSVSKPHLIKGINQAFLRYEHEVFAAEQEDVSCYMSPIIHITSTKGRGWGLMELLSAIEAEFLVQDIE